MTGTNFTQHLVTEALPTGRGMELSDMHANFDEKFKETIRTKQEQLLTNPNIKTSMTQNIRNIVTSHDKAMLTASSRLLHAEVREQEAKSRSPFRSDLMSGEALAVSKSVSTLDLLKRQKNRSRYSNLNPATISTQFDAPPETIHEGVTRSPKKLNRPTTTIVMQSGDPDKTERIKEKFDIRNARKRDAVQASTHSYQIRATQHSKGKKWKDSVGATLKSGSMSTIQQRIKPPPVLVQY